MTAGQDNPIAAHVNSPGLGHGYLSTHTHTQNILHYRKWQHQHQEVIKKVNHQWKNTLITNSTLHYLTHNSKYH